MKSRSLILSVGVALAAAAVLAGCGKTYYFDGRVLPPSKLVNRVAIAIQNPGIAVKGLIEIVDAFYDTRGGFNGTPASFSIAGFGGALPITIQNMPEEQLGAVYSAGDGTFNFIDYAGEKEEGGVGGLNGGSSSIFVTRNRFYAFAASQASNVFTVVNQSLGSSTPLSLPGVYRVSVNLGGSVALAFVQNSNLCILPAATFGRTNHLFLRRALHLAQSRR